MLGMTIIGGLLALAAHAVLLACDCNSQRQVAITVARAPVNVLFFDVGARAQKDSTEWFKMCC